MTGSKYEEIVKACYSTWGETYYEEYYGKNAPYPPVHRDILIDLLTRAEIRNVLDAGCGPASFLRYLIGKGVDLYGFDLTPEMVVEARRIFAKCDIATDHIWEGSVLEPADFQMPDLTEKLAYDAAICIGVLPHIHEEADAVVIENLRNAVKEDGLVVLEARNQLFALFTLNRYTHQLFMEELIRVDDLRDRTGHLSTNFETAVKEMEGQFRMDIPPVRKGKQGEPGYDEILSRTHNPLLLREQFAAAGFKDVQLLFYHYHCLPPVFEGTLGEFFRRESLAMEDPTDWRGYFMASSFLLAGRRA